MSFRQAPSSRRKKGIVLKGPGILRNLRPGPYLAGDCLISEEDASAPVHDERSNKMAGWSANEISDAFVSLGRGLVGGLLGVRVGGFGGFLEVGYVDG